MKKPRLEAFQKVCKAKMGNITKIAEAMNVTRRSVQNWIENDKRFADFHQDTIEGLVDQCESQLNILINGIPRIIDNRFEGWIERPDVACILFTLKTRGKQRGWVERQEIMNMDNNGFLDILK